MAGSDALIGQTVSHYQIVERLGGGGNYQASTGSPFTVVIGGDPLGLKSADPYDVPTLLTGGACSHPINPGNSGNYLKLQCFAFPNPDTLRGNLGRNSIVGPGLLNFDMSLFKNNYIKAISEHFNAQFRMEVFNAFNRANFASPLDHRAVFDQNGLPVPGAGLIDTTQTPAREIRFGGETGLVAFCGNFSFHNLRRNCRP